MTHPSEGDTDARGDTGHSEQVLILGDVVTSQKVLRGGGMLVAEGTVVAVFDEREIAQHRPRASAVLDFSDQVVLPGFVDAHVHSFSGPGEGWEHSTRAAAAGGVTTIIEMPYDADAPVVTRDLFEAKRNRIQGSSVVDVALLATIAKQEGTGAVEPLIDAGACGFKVSLFETDPVRFPRISANDLLTLMRTCAEHHVVVGFHAEDTEIITAETKRYRASAPADPMSHGRSRPPVAENLATVYALQMASDVGCPVHIYHASLGSVIDLVSHYRAHGADATVETCPHYLLLDEDDMRWLGPFGKINPPLRSSSERGQLWRQLAAGSVTMLTSDHAPWPLARKRAKVIFDNASGAPGVDVLGPLILANAYLTGSVSLLKIATMLSKAPAQRFGLGRVKGELAPGMDADFCVFDPRGRLEIAAANSYSNAGWSPYEGWQVPGRITATFVRGVQVYDGHTVGGSLDHGRFVPRSAEADTQ